LPSDSASGNNGAGPRSRHVTTQRVVVLGYILAFAMPPFGLAIGLALLLPRGVRSRHGAWIVLLSVIAAAIWVLLISAGALRDTGQGY
jgi:hypothetical protein